MLFVESMRGDETPVKVRVKAETPGGAECETLEKAQGGDTMLNLATDEENTVQKLVQTDWVGALLLRISAGVQVLISFPLMTWLQVVDRTTAECYKRCFDEVAPHFRFAALCERKVRISTKTQMPRSAKRNAI